MPQQLMKANCSGEMNSAKTAQFAAPALSPDEVQQAIALVCGANRIVAKSLQFVFARLIRHPEHWLREARRVDRVGFSARYAAGQFLRVLDQPGNLALVQHADGLFFLLLRKENRWSVINADGETAGVATDIADERFVEAVVLRAPLGDDGRKQETSASTLTALWPLLRASWAEIGLASLFVNAGQLLLPLFSMLVYDKVVSNGVFETLWALVFGMMIYLLTDLGMRLVRALATERIGTDLTLFGDENLWHRLMLQTDFPAGGVARFLTLYRDLALSRDFVSSGYLLSIADLPFLALYLTVIGIVAWPLLLVALVLVCIYAALGFWLQVRANRLGREAEKATTTKLTWMGEMLASFDVARTVPGAGLLLRHWRELSDGAANRDGERRLAAGYLTMTSVIMQTFSTVAMLAAGAYLIDARQLSVGGLIACNILASRAMGGVASFFMVIGKWQDFRRAAQRLEKSLAPPDDRRFVPRADTPGHVSLIALSKRYEGRPPALDQVTLSFRPGERVALLGRPGAGKTTLLRCVAGLCTPSSGQILIDGLSLADIAHVDRARWLAWKSQDPALFAGTLEENIRVALGRGDEKRFAQALWASSLEDELVAGRMNLGMTLQERGANLSGGQRQKVALARAFVQPARILLLDEPTLGLDPDGERRLAERLPQLIDGETLLLMTTHSAILLSMSDRVVALDAGRVIADGPREKIVQIH